MSPAATMATASVGYQAAGTGLEIETAACVVSHTHACRQSSGDRDQGEEPRSGLMAGAYHS
jgi:hypothetical protein